MLILPVGAAMDPQNRRILLPRYEGRRFDDEPVDIGAVLALELSVLDGAKYELRKKCVIVRGELAQLSALERVHLGKRVVARLEQRRVASPRGQRRDDKFPRAGCFTADRAAREVDTRWRCV